MNLNKLNLVGCLFASVLLAASVAKAGEKTFKNITAIAKDDSAVVFDLGVTRSSFCPNPQKFKDGKYSKITMAKPASCTCKYGTKATERFLGTKSSVVFGVQNPGSGRRPYQNNIIDNIDSRYLRVVYFNGSQTGACASLTPEDNNCKVDLKITYNCAAN